MMRAWPVVLVMGVCLVGCGRPAATSPATATPASSPQAKASASAASLPMLAYTYDTTIQAPKNALAGLMDRHRNLCQSAGSLQCQVTAAEFSKEGGAASGTLTLRAAPDWLSSFRRNLDEDAKSAGGAITQQQTTTDDLTHDITDADAVVKSKIALRDRLQALIASRPGKLSDLLDIERELARLQGEIDSANSNLALMRQRVQTSTLTIRYATKGSGNGGVDMIERAVDSAADTSARTVAVLITLAAVFAPIAVLGGLIALAVAYFKRRRLSAKHQSPSEA